MFRSILIATVIALSSNLVPGWAAAQQREASAIISPYFVVAPQDAAAGSCLRDGLPSSNGAVTCHADGHLYECRDGSWRVDSRSSCDPVDPPFSAAVLTVPGDMLPPGEMYLPGDTFRPSAAR